MRTRTNPERTARPIAVLIALLAGGCTLFGERAEKIEAQRNWNEVRAKVKCQLARQQLEAGSFDAAITSAEEAISLDPLPAAFVVSAQAHIEKGDWAAASRVIDAGARIGGSAGCLPNSPPRRSKPANAPARPAGGDAAEWAELLYLRGVIHERHGRFDDAVEVYREVRQLAPAAVEYLVAEVECLVADGRIDEAREVIQTEGGRYERDGTVALLSAQIALLVGDEQAATAQLRAAMDQVKNEGAVAGQYGILLGRCGRHAEAVAVLRPLVEQQGAAAAASLVRGLASSQLALGHFDEARTLLLPRVQSTPNEAWSWLLLARAAIGLADLPTTRRCAGEIRRLRPGAPESDLIDGYVSWKQGDLTAAERALVANLTANPRDTLTLCLMGEVLNQDGRVESACQYFRRALQIDPTCRWAKARLSELDPRRSPAFSNPRRVLGQAP